MINVPEMKIRVFGTVLACLLVAACHSHKNIVSKRELIKYVNNPSNDLFQEQEVKGIKVRISLEPASLLIAQELGVWELKDINGGSISKLENKYDKNYYFVLKFSKEGKEVIRELGSFDRYSSMLQVFSFQMQQFVNLTMPVTDTVALADYTYEQNYGMADGNSMLLVFAKDKIANNPAPWIVINVGECGLGIGNLKFRFRKKDIASIPQLDYTKLN
jgi:hypothetical protein